MPTETKQSDLSSTAEAAVTSPSEKKGPHLAIEAPGAHPANNENTEQKVRTLDVGEGQPIKLDALGPMIINSDGTMSRIQNWHELHPIEQERTVRLLVKKRNLVRLKKLDDAEGPEATGDALTALQENRKS